MVKEKKKSGNWIKSFWICHNCCEDYGGKSPEFSSEGKIGRCPYCKEASTVLLPWTAFDYPNDTVLDRHAKRSRD